MHVYIQILIRRLPTILHQNLKFIKVFCLVIPLNKVFVACNEWNSPALPGNSNATLIYNLVSTFNSAVICQTLDVLII